MEQIQDLHLEYYGVNVGIVALVFFLFEILFHLGTVIILWAMFHKVTWKDFRNFSKLRRSGKISLKNPGVAFGWTLNRLGASVPWVYTVAVGWGQLPWFVVWPMLIEVGIVATIGVSFSYREKFKKVGIMLMAIVNKYRSVDESAIEDRAA